MKLRITLNGTGGELDAVTVAVGSTEGFFSVEDLVAALKGENNATWLLSDGDTITVREVVEQVAPRKQKVTGMGEYHGSAADRGSADAWYNRPRDPHYWPKGSYNGTRVEAKDMVAAEHAAYNRAFDEGMAPGADHKDWG